MRPVSEARLPGPVGGAVVAAYAALWGVDLDEAEPSERPYPTLDAFFTRRLRQGARPIADSPLVSPCDGSLKQAGRIVEGRWTIKGSEYTVSQLTGVAEDDIRFRGGSHALFYLSPRDYHRVHAPVDGEALSVTGILGDLYPVNAIGEQIPNLYARNSRVAIHLETRDFGAVAVVLVGAMIVGKIGIETMGGTEAREGTTPIAPPRSLSRGDELGAFHFGSSVIVLLEREVSIVETIQRVRYGESLLRGS